MWNLNNCLCVLGPDKLVTIQHPLPLVDRVELRKVQVELGRAAAGGCSRIVRRHRHAWRGGEWSGGHRRVASATATSTTSAAVFYRTMIVAHPGNVFRTLRFQDGLYRFGWNLREFQLATKGGGRDVDAICARGRGNDVIHGFVRVVWTLGYLNGSPNSSSSCNLAKSHSPDRVVNGRRRASETGRAERIHSQN